MNTTQFKAVRVCVCVSQYKIANAGVKKQRNRDRKQCGVLGESEVVQ